MGVIQWMPHSSRIRFFSYYLLNCSSIYNSILTEKNIMVNVTDISFIYFFTFLKLRAEKKNKAADGSRCTFHCNYLLKVESDYFQHAGKFSLSTGSSHWHVFTP